MKVAISAQGGDLEALVDPRFGRARWLIFADTNGDDWQAHDNDDNVNASGGAGIQAGTTVAEHGAKAVITGNVGPNAHRVLAAAGIAIYQAGNGVRRARCARGAQERRPDDGGGADRAGSLELEGRDHGFLDRSSAQTARRQGVRQ
jgi:predicted Fe-Mo cluster-binding NifX family protein